MNACRRVGVMATGVLAPCRRARADVPRTRCNNQVRFRCPTAQGRRLVTVLFASPVLGAVAPLAHANYVGRGYLYGDYFRGAYAQLEEHVLYAYLWPQNYVKNMLYVHDPAGDFIEAGQFVGTIKLGGCDEQTVETVIAFWGDWRPGSNYRCHAGGTEYEGSQYGTTIWQTAKWGTTWNVTPEPLRAHPLTV